MKHANIIKSIFAAVTILSAAGVQADTWRDPDTLYTWTYRINGDTAEIYGHSERTYEEDIWSDPTYRFFPAISPPPRGAVTIPSTLGGNGGLWSFSK